MKMMNLTGGVDRRKFLNVVHYIYLPPPKISRHFLLYMVKVVWGVQTEDDMAGVNPSSCRDSRWRHTITSANICFRLIFISPRRFSLANNKSFVELRRTLS